MNIVVICTYISMYVAMYHNYKTFTYYFKCVLNQRIPIQCNKEYRMTEKENERMIQQVVRMYILYLLQCKHDVYHDGICTSTYMYLLIPRFHNIYKEESIQLSTFSLNTLRQGVT